MWSTVSGNHTETIRPVLCFEKTSRVCFFFFFLLSVAAFVLNHTIDSNFLILCNEGETDPAKKENFAIVAMVKTKKTKTAT